MYGIVLRYNINNDGGRMALTSEDLNNISKIVSASKVELKQELGDMGKRLREDMDRMETRLITAINLLQRDSFSRLDDHEARIRRLEQASSR